MKVSKPWPDGASCSGVVTARQLPAHPVQRYHLTVMTSERVTYTQRREPNQYIFVLSVCSVRRNELNERVILPKMSYLTGIMVRLRIPKTNEFENCVLPEA